MIDLLLHLLLLFRAILAKSHARDDHDESVLQAGGGGDAARSYRIGESFTVECLNTTESGEHISDSMGELQYVPFPTTFCKETKRPLELHFGTDKDTKCTIPSLDESLFRLFEFYVHHDAPLTCRIPSLPKTSSSLRPADFTQLHLSLTGSLRKSHLQINPNLNVIIHTTPMTALSKTKKKKKTSSLEGQILAATAYSLPTIPSPPKFSIADPLPLQLSVRWYSARTLPASTSRLSSGLGGHIHLSTVMYCLLSFGGGVAVSLAYFRGVELPRRMRRYGVEKLGIGSDLGRGSYAFPGKRD